MKAKVIHTKISKGGVIHVEDRDLPPGEVDLIVLLRNSEPIQRPFPSEGIPLPLGGYKAGWLSPEQLRRQAIYEED